MRISRVAVGKWRNLRGLEIVLPVESGLVCLVGENGTGKSNLLELVGYTSHQLGLTPGVPDGRPYSFEPDDSVEVEYLVTDDPWGQLVAMFGEAIPEGYDGWDGRVTVRVSGGAVTLSSGGLPADFGNDVAHRVQTLLRSVAEVNYLYLDANRSNPPKQITSNEYAQSLEQDSAAPAIRRQQSYLRSQTMNDEWLKYMLSEEGQYASRHAQAEREAVRHGLPRPEFRDMFAGYSRQLAKVLPHLSFIGVDLKARTLVFDTSGIELKLDALSGGEREVCFLVGQIDRFQLRRGLFLIDEPELHLNPDLLRNLIAFMQETIEDGQVWIATHSLEAAEVAGPDATVLLERDSETKLVRTASIGDKPLRSLLAAALGSPAFSLDSLRFVFVEGERMDQERERFGRLCDNDPSNRFLEAGNCRAVTDTLALVDAYSIDIPLAFGGVIDRDFRSDAEVSEIETESKLHVLRVDEVENFFLFPPTLDAVLEATGGAVGTAGVKLVEAADPLFGLWLTRYLAAIKPEWRREVKKARESLHTLSWSTVVGDREAAVNRVVEVLRAQDIEAEVEVRRGIDRYGQMIEDGTFWRYCFGKETLGRLAQAFGFSSGAWLEQAVLRRWSEGAERPPELEQLRAYVAGIQPN